MSVTRPRGSTTPLPRFATRHRLRFVTAASLFDGHDAAINIVRRILQQEGAEVIHLGHNRSVQEIVEAAVEEDVQAVSVSSYQGGHMEFFTYLVELLREKGCGHVRVFGGGGGTITEHEAEELHRRGVEHIYSVEDGRRLGLVGMIRDMMTRADFATVEPDEPPPERLAPSDARTIARTITLVERLHEEAPDRLAALREHLERLAGGRHAPVVGITGTGGAGKSSLTDELVRRMRLQFPDRTFAILSIDPTSRRTGGALLGDRIRMNAASGPQVYMRSMATRRAHASTAGAVGDALRVLQAAGFDLILLETAGIGQSDSAVADLADVSMYVMTPEYGAASQLEKIDMLGFADLVAINKADKRGAQDALRDVRKQFQRNHRLFDRPLEEMPVLLCSASRFGDHGVDEVFAALMRLVGERSGRDWTVSALPERMADVPVVIPGERTRYLAEIVETIRGYKRRVDRQADLAARADGLARALTALGDDVPPVDRDYEPARLTEDGVDPAILVLRQRYHETLGDLQPEIRRQLAGWDEKKARYEAPEFTYTVRDREVRVPTHHVTLAGTRVPKVALPRTRDWGELARWQQLENVPGEFPFTAGVFPFKRTQEDPTRMFAGEGIPERTNRRFHFLSLGQPAARLSTAYDSVTLYGEDPDRRPDIYGKIGNSGVSVCTLDDSKRLYSGFDLCAPTTSVSMTINGPAPMLLAFFLNTAIDQLVERRLRETGRWDEARRRILELTGGEPPVYRGELPEGHDGSGLGLLGVSGDQLLPREEYEELRAQALSTVRGTVQADILKEDQAQNTCIFSTEFALKMMGDVQEYFIEHDVRNFYSVSISGYHIAEAGANPITQLAFTLANGFTYVEYFRSRGMDVDRFARNLSFFFSNGLDAEYAVIGRVARRIWAIAMRELYGAGERSQKLKYHIQTSGRSLHAREIAFNDIRTTLQALYAIADNCNSLHTNAYDEALTTPTEESVRRALAIQLIINRELGWTKNENPLQGAFLVELLTELVEEAVLDEFLRLSERGGVLGAMETMYQRSKIQEESLYYETLKHSGDLPIVGVNTFVHEEKDEEIDESKLIRSTTEEKEAQVEQVQRFHERHREAAERALAELRRTAIAGGNVFAALMEAAKVCTLGQMTRALYDIGGQYRRNM
ncbi:MAG: methylmalonyl-CoA mutase family protein [Acidobacteriota bacterium]